MSTKLFFFTILLQCVFANKINAQSKMDEPLLKEPKSNNYPEKIHQDTLLNSLTFRNIGPTVMSGRITDVEINPDNTNEMYVAYASGGVWHTVNNGMSFTPIFDHEAAITIGDMAVNWKENIIWVGTGECNSSRSSYAGNGIYKSIDSGKTWKNIGLHQMQHISRIVLHPTNKNKIFVASVGKLYSDKNKNAGLFTNLENGTWRNLNIKPNNDSLGVIDLIMDAKNTNTMYACTWSRSRKAWHFNGNSIDNAIYKTTDAGETWTCITGSKSGLPKDSGICRIGIAQCASKPNVLYALVDNQNRQAISTTKKNELTALQIKDMNETTFALLDDKKINDYLKKNGYDEKYTATVLKADIKAKKYKIADIANWILSDGDAALFQTPVIGAELYKSEDAGKTWNKTHTTLLEGLYFTYGYYFGTIAVHPTNENEVYVGGYTVLKSEDAGKTFKEIVKDNCHADHHRIWLNPKNPKHIVLGNDGGINISYDDGKKWYKGNNPAVAQCYAIAVDDAKPYNVYAGLQDNGTWVGPSNNSENEYWQQSGQYAYKEIGGGDGMQIMADNRDNETIYTGYQFGFYQRSNRTKNEDGFGIHPSFDIGKKPLRYNWQTPILLSKHNQDILYMGSNCFHRSMTKGADMKQLSEDLTTTKNKGNVPFGTITTISESPIQFGLLYCGTDDGNLWMSNDVGANFTKINIPNNDKWVSRIVASKYNKAKVYVTINGYRNDDFGAYIYVSNDNGKTWKSIANNLPNEPINVIREDPKNEKNIYVGTDNGLYVSIDGGASYKAWQGGLPRVAVHDIAIQERENEIVLGTHGRSIYIAKLDEIQILDSIQKNNLTVLPIAKTKPSDTWGNAWAIYADVQQANIPIQIFINKAQQVNITIANEKKEILFTTKQKCALGFTTYIYKGNITNAPKKFKSFYKGDDEKMYLQAGKYFAIITTENGDKKEQAFEIGK
jgi:photosystem II stability/assembly factor-like uncharacterized protein